MASAPSYTLLVGCYNGPNEKGLHSFQFDPQAKTITKTGNIPIDNPSAFLQVPDSDLIYTVSECPAPDSGVYVVRYNGDSKTNPLSLAYPKLIPVLGGDPCSITLAGDAIITANYGSEAKDGGSISIIPLKNLHSTSDTILEPTVLTFKLDKIGPDTERQATSHIHTVRVTPDKKHLIATDLGADRLYVYALDEKQSIINPTPAEYKLYPGSGPRHIEMDAEGKFIYVISELHGTIDVLHISPSEKDGPITWLSPRHPDVPIELDRFQLVLAEPNRQRGSADIHISHDGEFLYTSHRSTGDDAENSKEEGDQHYDGISVFKRNKDTGQLKQLAFTPTKAHPRQFSISPDDKYLFVACRHDDVVQIFSRDITTGLLTEVKDVKIDVEQPAWVEFRI